MTAPWDNAQRGSWYDWIITTPTGSHPWAFALVFALNYRRGRRTRAAPQYARGTKASDQTSNDDGSGTNANPAAWACAKTWLALSAESKTATSLIEPEKYSMMPNRSSHAPSRNGAVEVVFAPGAVRLVNGD